MTVTAMSEILAVERRGSVREEELTAPADAFAALVTRQSRFVFRVAYAVLRNAHDAEDVAQETFLRLYRSGRWRHAQNERAFLARTAWRLAVDRRRRIRPAAAELELISGEADPERAAISSDWSATVRRLVDSLPEELRQPLALSALEDCNSRQIAEVMDIPEATVRGRLMRARQILKQKLESLKAGHHGS